MDKLRRENRKFSERTKVFDSTLDEASEKIVEKGYARMKREHDPGGKDPKVYHVSEHPKALERRADEMAKILHLSPSELKLTRMAIAWHDVVLAYTAPDPDKILGTVKRHRGAREGDIPKRLSGNEAKSAILLAQEMRKANERAGREVFSPKQMGIATWAIDATYPSADFGLDGKGVLLENYPYFAIAQANPELAKLLEDLKTSGIVKGTLFSQPHLEEPLERGEKVPHEVLVVALSDLGSAGTETREGFFKEGDSEAQEIYINLRTQKTLDLVLMQNAAGRGNREKVTNALLSWLDTQVGFAVFQALRFEKIMHLSQKSGTLTDTEILGLRSMFGNYTENARASYARVKSLRAELTITSENNGEYEAFLHLLRTMHFPI